MLTNYYMPKHSSISFLMRERFTQYQ